MKRRAPWTVDDRTGGPLDEVFDTVRSRVPILTIERLAVTHAADDDNVYFLGDANDHDRVQVDSGPAGRPPFVIEGAGRIQTSNPAEAVNMIVVWLGTDLPGRS